MPEHRPGRQVPLAGEKPEEAVSVEVVQEGNQPAVANITVKPQAVVESKPLEFQFSVPLGA